MIQKFLFFSVVVFLLSSCAHSPVAKKELQENVAAITGSVTDQALLTEGGDLALTPFKAGPRAEDNEELDHLSMMVLKGIKETLDRQNTSLHIIDSEEAKPQIVLEGYFEEYSKTGRAARMMMHKNKSSLVAEGNLWLVSTGKRLLTFSIKKKFNPKKEKPSNVAYAMGCEIGTFIASNSKE